LESPGFRRGGMPNWREVAFLKGATGSLPVGAPLLREVG